VFIQLSDPENGRPRYDLTVFDDPDARSLTRWGVVIVPLGEYIL
jgi:hypothetical protein